MKKLFKALGLIVAVGVAILAVGYTIPERCAMPCGTPMSYNQQSFWTHPLV